MTYYRRHVFVCENHRDGEKCCAETTVAEPVKKMRLCLKKQGAHGAGRVRINRAGCFDRCPSGPVLVVYPDNVWYRYDSAEDLQEIAESHLLHGDIVRRLQLPDNADAPAAGASANYSAVSAAKSGAANGGIGESDKTSKP